MTLAYPVRNQVYSLQQIMNDLNLDDLPFLNFRHEGVLVVIQDGEDDPLEIPEMANSLWKYLYTTDEMCPIFHYVGEVDILTLVDVREYAEPMGDDKYEAYFKKSL